MTRFVTHLADADGAARAAALRRAVYVGELGAAPDAEADAFDAGAEHLVLSDTARPELGAVGTLRLAMGSAYTSREFDLSALDRDPRPLSEIGRMCLHPDCRGGMAGVTLLCAALERLRLQGAGLVVGTGSFPGADAVRHMPALRALRDAALAPAGLRPRAHGPGAVAVEGPASPAAMRDVPALIKTYVRAGARVGDGAWVDHAIGTVDVCLVLDLDRVRLPAAAMRKGARP